MLMIAVTGPWPSLSVTEHCHCADCGDLSGSGRGAKIFRPCRTLQANVVDRNCAVATIIGPVVIIGSGTSSGKYRAGLSLVQKDYNPCRQY